MEKTAELALDLRLESAGPMDMVRGIVLNTIFGIARQHLPENTVQALDPDGTGSRQPFAEYPVGSCIAVLQRALPLLASREGGESALLWRIGADTVAAVSSSPMGKAAMALKGNPHALMESFAQSSRPLLVGYGSRSLSWTGDRSARITYRRALLPAAVPAGMYAAMLTIIGAGGVKVEYRELQDLTQEFDISWDTAE